MALKECPCGSGEWPNVEYDARGIGLGYMCHVCRKEKLARYRPEVLTDPHYDTMGERIDDDY